MAFQKATKGKNPTGDKAFNAITKAAFKPSMTEKPEPDADDQQPDDGGGPPPTKAPPSKGGKGKGNKGAGGGKKYDAGTNSFRSC